MQLTNRYAKLVYKTTVRLLPHELKYGAVAAWQRTKPPYHLVRPGETVVQVGVAGQLCEFGRSQALIYARFVGASGQVLGYEAIPKNVELFRAYAARHGISNVDVHATGLWRERGVLTFDALAGTHGSSRIKIVRPDEPYRYDSEREFPVDTLDNLLAAGGGWTTSTSPPMAAKRKSSKAA